MKVVLVLPLAASWSGDRLVRGNRSAPGPFHQPVPVAEFFRRSFTAMAATLTLMTSRTMAGPTRFADPMASSLFQYARG